MSAPDRLGIDSIGGQGMPPVAFVRLAAGFAPRACLGDAVAKARAMLAAVAA